MSTKTGIEWTDATWNPIRGCSRVSEGCRNCYAETRANRFCGPGKPYEGVVQIGADGRGNGKWNGQIKFVEKHLLDPLKWKAPRRIFVNSMSDLFHENVTDDMLDRVHGVMWACEFMAKGEVCWPGHTFQILTKRAARLPVYYGTDRRKLWAKYAVHYGGGHNPDRLWEQVAFADHLHPRIWLGVSVENQAAADERIPLLLQTPAAVRFISAEPLLGAIDLTKVMDRSRKRAMQRNVVESGEANPAHEYLVQTMGPDYPYERLDWVIVGGESGPGARPMHPHWARSLRDQCVAAGVPFFFKQWGDLAPGAQQADYSRSGACFTRINVAGNPSNDPTVWNASDALFYRVGKKAAGRLLDGREWNEMPAAREEGSRPAARNELTNVSA